MRRGFKGLLVLVIVVLVGILGVLVWGNFYENSVEGDKITDVPLPSKTPMPERTAEPVESTPKPENLLTATLAVAGDFVCHASINEEAKVDGGYDYTAIMESAAGYISAADYAVCTLETTFAGGPEYTGYPMFRSPDDLAASLKAMGFDLINTASNHSVDSFNTGLVRTLNVLETNGLEHVGTYRSQEERDANNGIKVVDVNGISIAFLSYTYGTNGMPVTDYDYSVNLLFKDYLTNFTIVDYEKIDADMAMARALKTDIIAVFLHWGTELETTPVPIQYELADHFFKEGADIILGGHPHVPEPMEMRTFTDNGGNERTGFIVYCLGNFISSMNDKNTNLTAILNLELEKNLDTGETIVASVGYVPMYMVDLEDHEIYGNSWRFRLWNLHDVIDGYESGNSGYSVITEALYNSLTEGLDTIHSIFGKEYDTYYANSGE